MLQCHSMTDDQFEKLAQMMKEGFDDTNARIDEFRDEMYLFRDEMYSFRDETRENFREIRLQLSDVERRLDLLEEQGASNAGFAKEIDGLRSDVAAIKKHIGLPIKVAA